MPTSPNSAGPHVPTSHWVQIGEIPAIPRSHRSRWRNTPATVPAGHVAARRLPSGPGRVGHEAADQSGREQRQGCQDEEHVPPRHELPEGPAHQDAERRPDPQPRERRSLPEREPVSRSRGRDDGPVVGEVHSLGEAGQKARQRQDGQRAGEPRDHRRPGHQQDPEDQHALPPEAVAEEPRRHLHRHVPVEEHREEKAALGVAQAELRHDGLEQRREGHAHDVVADPAEDQKRPHGVVGLPGHGSRSDQAWNGAWVRIVGARRVTRPP